MELKEFKDYPNTTTPINSENLNFNFNQISNDLNQQITSINEKIGNLDDLTTENKNNIVGAMNSIDIPTKVSELENDSKYITRPDSLLMFQSLDAFKEYIKSDSVPSNSLTFYALFINGSGNGAIVQKTSNAYFSFIYFGYSNNPVFWKYINGSWSSQNL